MFETGAITLGLAFTAALTSAVCAIAARVLSVRGDLRADRAWRTSGIASIIVVALLSFAIGVLAWCFITDDFSLIYVAYNHSTGEGQARLLSRLSALWAGKSGSLLLWVWLVAIWSLPAAVRVVRRRNPFHGVALGVIEVVLVCLVGTLLFSSDNMPFWPTSSELLDDSGALIGAASDWGISSTLDHWAMDVHPFLLFAGYSGFTVPCALTVSFLLGRGEERAWRREALRSVALAWAFMSAAILLGAIWAGSTPGWSGYWSWDTVETASLMPWIAGIVAVVAFMIGGRDAKALRCAAVASILSFAGVMLCAFVTRSGVIATIHGYAGDSASAFVFAVMGLVSILVAIAACVGHRAIFDQGECSVGGCKPMKSVEIEE